MFNALGVDPGLKWRFVVPAGHAEVGLANARRHALFERCAAEFLDPDADPSAVMAEWEDRLLAVPNEAPPADAGASGDTGSLFADAPASSGPDPVRELINAYERTGRTLDDLPYTDDFEQLYTATAKATRLDRAGTVHKLQNLRKAGKLPRLGKAATKPVKLEPEEESALAELVVEAAGTLGQRDRLLYTADFDAVAERFNARTGRSLDHHALWRLVAKLAK